MRSQTDSHLLSNKLADRNTMDSNNIFIIYLSGQEYTTILEFREFSQGEESM